MVRAIFSLVPRLYKYSRVLLFIILAGIGIVALKNSNDSIFYVQSTQKTFHQSVPYEDKYCVIYDYWEATEEFKRGDHITLVLHSTPSFVGYLKEHIHSWDGGISLSMFIPTPEINLANFTHIEERMIDVGFVQLHLQAIFVVLNNMEVEKMSGKVSLHLFFEKQKFETCPTFATKDLALNAKIADLAEFLPANEVYPINPARNIARRGCGTKLFISGDIEQIFVHNFEPRMKKLAKKVLLKENRKLVLVHRRFEIAQNVSVPRDKHELAVLLDRKLAFPFHKFVYNIGHYIPDLNGWLKTKENLEDAKIYKILNYTNAEWEPQFVGDDLVPFHDDRFPFRLRSNTHVGTLLCYHGYQFAIVSDLFTVHRGIKKDEPDKFMSIKQVHIKKGYKKMVNSFINELNNKYPVQAKRCPLLLP